MFDPMIIVTFFLSMYCYFYQKDTLYLIINLQSNISYIHLLLAKLLNEYFLVVAFICLIMIFRKKCYSNLLYLLKLSIHKYFLLNFYHLEKNVNIYNQLLNFYLVIVLYSIHFIYHWFNSLFF